MSTVFVARKINLSDAFKEKAERRLGKLDKFFDDFKTQVTVSTQKDTATVELTVWANNMVFRAERTDESKTEALDAAIETIIRRIRKNKTKLQKKVKASGFDNIPEEFYEEAKYDVIRVKEVALRPMSEEEAILQMNMLGHNFFVFLNAASGDVNVVYRRKTEGYGLIVPEK